MPRENFHLFGENERILYEYLTLYHVQQYIPELFPDAVIKKLQILRRLGLVVKQGIDADALNASGALLMMENFKRPEEKRKIYYDKLNDLLVDGANDLFNEDAADKYTTIWSDIASTLQQRENLLHFLDFIVQTDIPMKPVGYIVMKKLEQDVFWEKYRESHKSEKLSSKEEISELQKEWEDFHSEHVHWISAQKKETIDGFSEENIFRCLNLIQKKKIARINGKEYYPIRVYVLDTEWLYRRKIPYLVARSKDDNTIVLLRLDQHTTITRGKTCKDPLVWVSEQDFKEKLGKSNPKISGAYFYNKYSENEYICGKLKLEDDIAQPNKNDASIYLPYHLPYQEPTEQAYQVNFEITPPIDEVERELFMRSCGEFVHFHCDDRVDIDSGWDSAEEWKNNNAYDNTLEKGTVDAEVGLANKNNSWDIIHAPFTCIELMQKNMKLMPKRWKQMQESMKQIQEHWKQMQKNTEQVQEYWQQMQEHWEFNVPQKDICIWMLDDTELDWLYTALVGNKELAEYFFGINSSIMNIIKEKLDNEPQPTFRLSEFCKNTPRGEFQVLESIWNQEFNILSSNPFANDGMKTAFQCAKKHQILRYTFNNHKKNERMDCEIFPYHFQITKDEKIQLIAYDLKKFKLLSINNFGSNDYSHIAVHDLSDLSDEAKLFLYHSSIANRCSTSVSENKNEKLLAAREIVYYYKLLLNSLPDNLYTSDGYDGKTLDTMLGKLKGKFYSVRDRSVFSPVTVNQKTFSICSRIIKGGKLWNNENRAMKKWSIEGWLDKYKFGNKPIQPLKSSDFSQQDKHKFDRVYAKAGGNSKLTSILEHAFQHYRNYIDTNMSDTDENFAWNTDIYHPAQELRHIYHVLEKVSQENQDSLNFRSCISEDHWLEYLQDEIQCLNDAKQCTAILGIRGELSMERLDLIYHILNEFDLTTEAVVCNPDDFYSEDADKFEIVRCIRVKYSSYSFRKLHEGILALQDFIYPLAPVDLKEIIQKRKNNMTATI